jgi:hypothetical protein
MDDAATLRYLAAHARSLEDVADRVSGLVGASWIRGDRLLCAACHDQRNGSSGQRVRAGVCDGCGDECHDRYRWNRDDLTGYAEEYVRNAEWLRRHES